ncbi:metallophosphoesterase [Demequina sp. NBRC 110054]|uniref:metallophosphoesterase n=1 Tax=Demequina sp. NBRC 110054 TaxID=1570343 RepID=UPI000A051B3D|nr:metallophosphoesterase [Demequina sp. NBRC 110054]
MTKTTMPARAWAASTAAAVIAGTAIAMPAVAASAETAIDASAVDTSSVATATEGSVEDTGSRFTVAVLPDTQFYSRYSEEQFYPTYGTNPFEAQAQFIVDNDETLNTAFTLHLGDVVDQQGESDQWEAADKAISILEDGGAEYSILPGNHDVSDMGVRSSESNAANYLSNFPASRLAEQDSYVGSYQNGYSSAYTFEAEGQEFLVLAIGWNASADTFDWAQGILDANPTLPTILTSHAIIDIDEETNEATDFWFGEEMWDSLITSNDQIFVTLNGHFHGQTYRTITNDYGNEVTEILLDSQMAADGGNGIMAMMEFDLDEGTIDYTTISPWVTQKLEDRITSSDTPVISGDGAQFTLDVDFEERFASFNPDFTAGDGEWTDLSALAEEIVSEGWDGGDGSEELEAAGNEDDYIEVEGTLAHWRFGDQEDGVVQENQVITDLTGDNDMHRLPLDQINAYSELDDMTIESDNLDYLSADTAAVCFDDADNTTGQLSYLTTDYGTPVTEADLSEGYTIESFVYLAEDWSADTNDWSGWLTRTGRRSALPVLWEQYDYEMGPAFLSISNLREFQWGTTQGSSWAYTNSIWSGEIMTGKWHHVAVVNDPDANSLVMYVDGVAVLRNATDHNGMTYSDGYPWALGTNWNYDEADNGWNGCVGETRIVDHALEPSEFLIQRVDIDADGENFSIDDEPTGGLPAGTEIAEFTGTGYPGAEVRVEAAAAVTGGGGVATAASAGTVLGSATVGSDGTWTIVLDEAISESGAHLLSFVQSMGTRDGDAASVVFTIGASTETDAGDSDGTDDAAGSGSSDDTGTSGSSEEADGTAGASDELAGSSDDDAADGGETDASAEDDLASTGAGDSLWVMLLGALGLIGVGGASLLWLRKAQGGLE